jgi:hypothetical protein
LRRVFTMEHHGFSRRSVLLISLFVIVFTAAVVVDFAALFEALNLIKGSWQGALETGAAASAAIAVPFLAMGMSISADGTN